MWFLWNLTVLPELYMLVRLYGFYGIYFITGVICWFGYMVYMEV